MSAGAEAATAHFVHKWWLREPEMRIAGEFCRRADGEVEVAPARARFRCWGALLHELREAAFELADPGVAAAKRGWWADELQAIAGGQARHPLGQSLQALPGIAAAPWAGLSRALLGVGGDAAHAADTAAAIASLSALGRATVAVENAVFQTRGAADAERALAVHWLWQRLPRGLGQEDGARIPMHLLARHGLTAAQLPAAGDPLLRDWARELAGALPARVEGAAYLRRAGHRFDAARLRRLAASGAARGFAEPPAPATLWRAWRAARGS